MGRTELPDRRPIGACAGAGAGRATATLEAPTVAAPRAARLSA